MRGATYDRDRKAAEGSISIHAPHARSDGSSAYSLVAADEFQSTLLMRGATKQAMRRKQPPIFQSTLLMRGATGYLKLSRSYHIISIHAPHARSDFGVKRRSQAYRISIHAPHARSDMPVHVHLKPFSRISIHAPHARSDCLRWRAQLAGCISIHAPHARSDFFRDKNNQ